MDAFSFDPRAPTYNAADSMKAGDGSEGLPSLSGMDSPPPPARKRSLALGSGEEEFFRAVQKTRCVAEKEGGGSSAVCPPTPRRKRVPATAFSKVAGFTATDGGKECPPTPVRRSAQQVMQLSAPSLLHFGGSDVRKECPPTPRRNRQVQVARMISQELSGEGGVAQCPITSIRRIVPDEKLFGSRAATTSVTPPTPPVSRFAPLDFRNDGADEKVAFSASLRNANDLFGMGHEASAGTGRGMSSSAAIFRARMSSSNRQVGALVDSSALDVLKFARPTLPTRSPGFSAAPRAPTFADHTRRVFEGVIGQYRVTIDGAEHAVVPLAKGSYMQAFEVVGRKRVVKTYFADMIDRNGVRLQSFMKSSMRECAYLDVNAPVQVAKILNDPLADHFILQEKVSCVIPTANWQAHPEKKVEELSQADQHTLAQIKVLIEFSVREGHPIDMHLQNFGFDVDGRTLVLFDFMEEDVNDPDEVQIKLVAAVKSWASRNANVGEYLISGIGAMNSDLAKDLLELIAVK